ncbi:MAG TPA: extracellular solute-binding protein [Streptosporangiaceae bacterium]|nr:extracellular solute-binding protein [Streptosporangiaceae bacterium]
MTAALGACSSSSSSTPPATSIHGHVGGSLTVWVDAVRLPVAKAYAKAHPNVHLHIVTFDGDGNGASTLQTKIQLWNRTGNGWPDVIFSEQVNDPVWMAQAPFNYAAPVNDGLIPAKLLSQWPAPSTAQCTIKGVQYCVQDNLAQVVLWVNKKLMDKFGYTVPTTWQEWAALGQKVAKQHPGYIIGNIGDSYGHWIYFWSNQCPLEEFQGSNLLINTGDAHCTEMANLLDPLVKDGALPPLSVFTPDFAQKYGGANDKVLMMPGPSWYATALFQSTLHIPAGQITAASPLQWESQEPITTGQVGGGPWIISRHSENLATAANFVEWATTVFNPSGTAMRPGYPAYAPLATKWLTMLGSNSYFASNPGPALQAAASQVWKGWDIVTYPDQPVWSNTVVTGLVAGKSLSSLMQPFGAALGQAAQAAGYQVVR